MQNLDADDSENFVFLETLSRVCFFLDLSSALRRSICLTENPASTNLLLLDRFEDAFSLMRRDVLMSNPLRNSVQLLLQIIYIESLV